ncbi:Hypothetical predicted protein [Pelobates cultripes]|uniref:Uncharacterized protein n=1 Tax=Pelobates cultripes TaxID=61616 RepID=A0AAD1T932_PELCU|nr:Hypothetical predicted protein [Pelobates cultripes]
MSNRKSTDGVRCSARQKNRSLSRAPTSSDHEAETCKRTRTTNMAPSPKGTEKRTSKKQKCDHKKMKYNTHGQICESGSQIFAKSNSPSCCDNMGSERAVNQPKSRGRKCPKTKVRATERSFSNSLDSSNQGVTNVTGDGSVFSDITQSEVTRRKRNISVDSNPFIDEDSNQPMPLTRFFENADLMQDIPPVMPSWAFMSRRQVRNLHFRAKDDDDDEEDDEDQEVTVHKDNV